MVVRRWTANDRLDRRRQGLRFANPSHTFIGVNDDDAIVIGAVEETDIRIFNPQVNRVHARNLHRCVSSSRP